MRNTAIAVAMAMITSPHFPDALRKPEIKATNEIRSTINKANIKYGTYVTPRISGLMVIAMETKTRIVLEIAEKILPYV
jgi:hypothetical protein